ncbi:MAG: ATP-binding protein [Candidatus Nitrosotenuis sp.]|nr:MAG: ATP-binding protein [Candidatus Nitrosotenuis sp.]
MIDLDKYIDSVRKKISVIPNFDKESIESLLDALPNLGEFEVKQIMQDIDSIVEPEYQKHKRSKNPILSFPSKEEAQGEIEIGEVYAGDQGLGYPFGLSRVDLTENIFGVGRAGSGKTTFLLNLIDQLEQNKIRYTVIDWKNDYTFLPKKYSDVNLATYRQFAYNPWINIPPGMDRRLWWFIVLDVVAHSTGLYVATPSHVLEALEEIYEIKDGRINSKDLYQYLKSQNESKKREEYNSTALNRLFLLNELLDDVINVDYGFDVEDIFKDSWIIQMAPLHEAVSSFLINVLLLWEYYRRLYKGVRADWKSAPHSYFLENFHMFIMDEAHLTQYGGHEHKDATIFSPPPLSIFFSQSRELGLATCAFTQFPNMVMSAFKTNAGTKVILNVVESDMREELGASIGLEKDDVKILGKLDRGFAVVNVAGRTKKPFLMKIPFIEKPIVAEAEILAISKPYITRLQAKRQEIESRLFMNHVERKGESVPLPELPKECWQFLDHVFGHPWEYQQKVTEALGFSDRKMAKVKDLLIKKNLIRIEKFPVKVHDRIYFVLTANALDLLQTVGKSPQMVAYWRWISTRPGFQHRFFQNYISVQHKILGWKGRLEYSLPSSGRRVDILEEKDGYRKAIELELSTSDIENKIRVLDEVDELVLLYNDETHLQFSRAKLLKMKDIQGEKIWIGTIRDYTELLENIIADNVSKAAETSGKDGKSGEGVPEDGSERKQGGDIEG